MTDRPLEPDAILRDLLRLDPGLRVERYYGERAMFYNPGRAAPLGTIFCAIKDHDGPNDRRAALSRPGHTVVFYMGLNQLETIVARLREHGVPETRAAAIIEQGTRSTQRVVTATLADLAHKVAEARVESPALLIVGEVTRLHGVLHWFNTQSLHAPASDNEGRLYA
jgi:hypothetical protein